MVKSKEAKKKRSTRFGRFIKKRFDYKRWIALDEIKRSTSNIASMFTSLLTIQTPRRVETFEEAKKRLKLDDRAIEQRCQYLANRANVYLLMAFAVLAYALYLIVYCDVLAGGICTMLLIGPALALAFRDKFWVYQLRRRRLGCSVEDWFRDNVWIAKIWFRD